MRSGLRSSREQGYVLLTTLAVALVVALISADILGTTLQRYQSAVRNSESVQVSAVARGVASLVRNDLSSSKPVSFREMSVGSIQVFVGIDGTNPVHVVVSAQNSDARTKIVFEYDRLTKTVLQWTDPCPWTSDCS
jgi:type II secretory pathway pseudopilin PulG